MTIFHRFPLAALLAATITALSACGGGDSPEQQASAAQVRLTLALARTRADHPWIPGILVRVTADQERSGFDLDWAAASGLRDKTTRAALQADDRYVMASVTKTYVAATILRLIESGQLTLSDNLVSRLGADSLARLGEAGYAPQLITLDMLLSHTAGLRDYVSDDYFLSVLQDPARPWTRDEQLAFAMGQGAPLWQAGAGYRYVDTGYVLLGEVIERTTGLALPQAVRQSLRLELLGMRATTWQLGDPVAPIGAGPLASYYFGAGPIEVNLLDVHPSVDLFGGGGLTSTTRDAAIFIRALVDGRVLGPAAQKRLLTLGPGARDDTSGGVYARGIERYDIDGTTCWGHTGAWGAMSVHCPAIGASLAFTLNINGDATGKDPFNAVAFAQVLLKALRDR